MTDQMTELQAFAWGFHDAMELITRDTTNPHPQAYADGYAFGQREFAKQYAAQAAFEHENEDHIPF